MMSFIKNFSIEKVKLWLIKKLFLSLKSLRNSSTSFEFVLLQNLLLVFKDFEKFKNLKTIANSVENPTGLSIVADLVNKENITILNTVFSNYKMVGSPYEMLRHSNYNSFAQEGEDIILANLFEGKKDGFFIDIGAYHPLRYSNTAMLYNLGWRGINIDPSPGVKELFDECRPEDLSIEVAVGEASGKANLFIFGEGAFNTMNPNRAGYLNTETRFKSQEEKTVEIKRLDEILTEHYRDKPIDFMSIDVEGYEMAVVKSNDWQKFRPRILLVENLTSEKNNKDIVSFLEKEDYGFLLRTARNYFFQDRRL